MTDSGIEDIAVYDSIQQVAAATSIPLATIKEAKAGGCPAFQSNRIRLAGLLKWLFKDNPGHAIDNAKNRLLMAEAQLAEAKAKAQSGQNKEEGEAVAKAVLTIVLAPLRQRLLGFPAMLAARVNPSDPELARAETEKAVDELLNTLPAEK